MRSGSPCKPHANPRKEPRSLPRNTQMFISSSCLSSSVQEWLFVPFPLLAARRSVGMPRSHAQIRQLLIEEECLLTDKEVAAQPLQQGSEAGSSSSRSSQKSSQRRAAHHAQPTRPSKAEAAVNGIFTVLRAAHRKLPVFDDARPDPGAAVEQLNYLQTVDPVFAPASRDMKVGQQHQRLL